MLLHMYEKREVEPPLEDYTHLCIKKMKGSMLQHLFAE